MRLEIRQKARKVLHEDLLALVDIMWGSDWPVDVGVLELARKPLYEITRPEILTLCSELLEKPQLVRQIAPIVRMLLEQNEVVLSGRSMPQRLNERRCHIPRLGNKPVPTSLRKLHRRGIHRLR